MVGDRLRDWRKSRELSQKSAAELVGCSQAMWGALESGEKRPGIDLGLAIQKLTNEAIRIEHWATGADTAATLDAADRAAAPQGGDAPGQADDAGAPDTLVIPATAAAAHSPRRAKPADAQLAALGVLPLPPGTT